MAKSVKGNKGTNLRATGGEIKRTWGEKSRGPGGSFLEEESGCVPDFKLGGYYSQREGQWEKGRLFEEVITHHGQRDSHKADKCFGLELRQDV